MRDPRLATRFDYDAVFGTVLNRFVIQAVLGEPLTVYGTGGQTRGLLDIRDTVECIRLAVENPADAGEFRVFNQMTESYSVAQIADKVAECFPGPVQVEHLENPRVEQAEHYYNVKHTGLVGLGLQPHLLSDTLIDSMFDIVAANKDRVDPAALLPTVRWKGHLKSARASISSDGALDEEAEDVADRVGVHPDVGLRLELHQPRPGVDRAPVRGLQVVHLEVQVQLHLLAVSVLTRPGRRLIVGLAAGTTMVLPSGPIAVAQSPRRRRASQPSSRQ